MSKAKIQSVSEAYLIGISDGRQELNAIKARGEFSPDVPRLMLENVVATLRRGFSGNAAEMLRGNRDFWKLQARNVTHNR